MEKRKRKENRKREETESGGGRRERPAGKQRKKDGGGGRISIAQKIRGQGEGFEERWEESIINKYSIVNINLDLVFVMCFLAIYLSQ